MMVILGMTFFGFSRFFSPAVGSPLPKLQRVLSLARRSSAAWNPLGGSFSSPKDWAGPDPFQMAEIHGL